MFGQIKTNFYSMQLYEMFKCVSCKQNGSCLGQSDFFNICQSLSDRRVLDIKNAKKNISINRQSKVILI